MGWIVVLIAIAAVLAVVTRKMLRAPGEAELYPYQRLASLLSPAERCFLSSLEEAVGDYFRIFAKVRVADVVTLKPLPQMSLSPTAAQRISGHQFDFVLCEKERLAIVGVVELDDQTAQQRALHSRDGFLIGLCRSVGLPLVHVRVQPVYSVEALRAVIFESLDMPAPTIADSADAQAEPSESVAIASIDPLRPGAQP